MHPRVHGSEDAGCALGVLGTQSGFQLAPGLLKTSSGCILNEQSFPLLPRFLSHLGFSLLEKRFLLVSFGFGPCGINGHGASTRILQDPPAPFLGSPLAPWGFAPSLCCSLW